MKLTNNILTYLLENPAANPETIKQLVQCILDMKESVQSVLWIDHCRCDDAYTDRGGHNPNDFCGEMDDLREVLQRWFSTETKEKV